MFKAISWVIIYNVLQSILSSVISYKPVTHQLTQLTNPRTDLFDALALAHQTAE